MSTFNDCAVKPSPTSGKWWFVLIVFLKRLLPEFVLAHIPHFWDDQAEVFGQRQGSFHGVTTSWCPHPQILVVTVLGANFNNWSKKCGTYIMANLFSSIREPFVLSFVERIIAASPWTSQVLKETLNFQQICPMAIPPPCTSTGPPYNRVEFPRYFRLSCWGQGRSGEAVAQT